MKHSQEEYWRPRFHAPPLRSHPDPPPTIQCSWYPYEGQCPYMHMDLARAKISCLALHQPPELRHKILPRVPDDQGGTAASSNSGSDQLRHEQQTGSA